MKSLSLASLTPLFVAVVAAGVVGCSPDFDMDEMEPEDFYCESDDDCIDHYDCNLEENHCWVEPDDFNQPDNNNNDDQQCDPEAEWYPPEDPSEYGTEQEVCDGTDSNCDGEVDNFSCQTDDDCPDEAYGRHGEEYDLYCQDGECVGEHAQFSLNCFGYECQGEDGFESVYYDDDCSDFDEEDAPDDGENGDDDEDNGEDDEENGDDDEDNGEDDEENGGDDEDNGDGDGDEEDGD